MKRLPLLFTVTVATLALLGLSSCSSDDGKTEGDASPTTTAAPSDDGSGSSEGDGPTTTAGGSSKVDGALVDRLVTSMMVDENPMFTEDQARCYAEANIRIVGADRIEQALEQTDDAPLTDDGTLDLNAFDYSEVAMTKAEAEEVYDAADGCGLDFRAMMLDSFEGSGMPASAKDCVEKVVTDDSVRTLMIAIMTEGPAAMMGGAGMEFSNALMACDPEVAGD